VPLTNVEIQNAKQSPTPAKLTDGRGLYLLVTPAGSKLWRWRFRFEGEEKLMAVGSYPDVSLEQACDKVDEVRKLFATGTDPMTTRKTEKIARRLAVEDTFDAVAKKWWESWKAAHSDSHTFFCGALVHRLAIHAPRFLLTLGLPHAVALHFTHCDQLAAGLAPAGVRPCCAHQQKTRQSGSGKARCLTPQGIVEPALPGHSCHPSWGRTAGAARGEPVTPCANRR